MTDTENRMGALVRVAESKPELFRSNEQSIHYVERHLDLSDSYCSEAVRICSAVAEEYPRYILDNVSIRKFIETAGSGDDITRQHSLKTLHELLYRQEEFKKHKVLEKLASERCNEERSFIEKLLDVTVTSLDTGEKSQSYAIDITDLIVQKAIEPNEVLQYECTKALSKILDSTSKNNRGKIIRLLHGLETRDDQTILETVIQAVTANIQKNKIGKTRGRTALTIGYIALEKPELIETNGVVDNLIDLLNTGEKHTRKRRALFALTFLGYYDAPEKEFVRKKMAGEIDEIQTLAINNRNKATQSVALRSLGFIALSYPGPVPKKVLVDAMSDDTLRPRSRSRSLRALWQLGLSQRNALSDSDLVEMIVGLLTYSTADAKQTKTLQKDEDKLEQHCKWLRSNAAKALAVAAADNASVVPQSAIHPLIRLVESNNYACPRAILTLGELSEKYTDCIIKNGGHEAVQNVLSTRDNKHIDDLSEREAARYGYAGWTLLKINDNILIDWEPTREILDLLFSVRDSEKIQFHRRRVEGISILISNHPTILDHDLVESYLTKRLNKTTDVTEKELIKVAQNNGDFIEDTQDREDGISGPRLENNKELFRSPLESAQVGSSNANFSYDDIQEKTPLGRGAADVYEAWVSTDEDPRHVVLKEPRFAGELDTDTQETFLDEVRYWAQVAHHPHVVDIIGWGENPHPWLVAEYLEGGDLSTRGTELDEALWICARIADALHEAHNLGLRHFDLKPENVLLRRVEDNPWDVPKVSDWGLARFQLEHSGRLSSFTPRYGAPEQFLPEKFGGLDKQTDLYQLGLILYELTTGDHPFPNRSGAVATEQLNKLPPLPTERDKSLPTRLDAIVKSLLAPQPVDRYDSAAVVRNDIDRLRTGEVLRQEALADRADLYASALEYARRESLRECQRWAKEIQKFVANNQVEDAAYEATREEVESFVEEWFDGRKQIHGSDHDLIIGGDIDLENEYPGLYHDIADVATSVRRLYLRAV